MGYITLQSVTFAGVPASVQSVTIQYRLTSDPDVPGSYTILPGVYSVQTNGDIAPDVTITGLLDGTSYTVQVIPECGGGSAELVVVTGDPNVRPVYFGTKATGTVPTEAEILAGTSVIRNVSLNVALNWGVTSPTPTWYWLAIPDVHVNALKTEWSEIPPNNGTMLGPTDLFNVPTTVSVLGVNHHVHISNFATQFTDEDYTFSA